MPTNITVTGPLADPTHPQHSQFRTILDAILAIFQRVEPVVVTLVPPTVGAGLEVGAALAPTVGAVVDSIDDQKK